MPREAAAKLVETIERALEDFKAEYGLDPSTGEEEHEEPEEEMVGRGRKRRPMPRFTKKAAPSDYGHEMDESD